MSAVGKNLALEMHGTRELNLCRQKNRTYFELRITDARRAVLEAVCLVSEEKYSSALVTSCKSSAKYRPRAEFEVFDSKLTNESFDGCAGLQLGVSG